jgi:hypothetical protein
MKVIQAFSWALFIMFVLAEIALFQLVSKAQELGGRRHIWGEPIRGMLLEETIKRFGSPVLTELGWYGEYPGYYGNSPGPTPYGVPPSSAGIIIQPGMNGAPATVTRY